MLAGRKLLKYYFRGVVNVYSSTCLRGNSDFMALFSQYWTYVSFLHFCVKVTKGNKILRLTLICIYVNYWKKTYWCQIPTKYVSCSVIVTPWTVAHQAPLSMEFSRQEYWIRFPFPPPEDLPNPGMEPWFPAYKKSGNFKSIRSYSDQRSLRKGDMCFFVFLTAA